MTTPAAPVGPHKPAWPSGVRPDDPRPTPIRLTNLWRWAQLTWRAERRYYGRLDRPSRLTSTRLAASIRPDLDDALFIVGAPRSGTTFLGDCIGRLPEISYHHEPPATKAGGRYVFEKRWGFARARWFYSSVYSWLMRVELDGHLRFSEKTPTNSLLIPFLARAFPRSTFIHIIRDGRDAAISHMQKPWLLASSRGSTIREPGGYLLGPFAPWWVEPDRRDEFETTSDIHRMIWSWRRYTEAAVRDGQALGPQRYLEIRYEDLIREPAAESERILDFLGIKGVSSRTAFLDATGRAEPSGRGGWRDELSATDLAIIEADSGDLLVRLGYAA